MTAEGKDFQEDRMFLILQLLVLLIGNPCLKMVVLAKIKGHILLTVTKEIYTTFF